VFVNFQIFEIIIPSLHYINSYLNFFFLLHQIFKAKLHIPEHSKSATVDGLAKSKPV